MTPRDSDGAETMPPLSEPDGSAAALARAISIYFEGDQALFAQMQTHARLQFSRDTAAGDAALAAGDTAALRRVAHSLKTVLRMLGHPQASQQALALEDLLAANAPANCHQPWAALRQRVTDLTEVTHISGA